MTAAQAESLSTEGVRSLEVRWIFPGELSAVVAGWFARFQAETTVLEDVYLLDPHLPGLSVKVRDRRALEVKVYRGSPGFFEVAGRAHGRLESWQKWSFPHGPASLDGGDLAGWMPAPGRDDLLAPGTRVASAWQAGHLVWGSLGLSVSRQRWPPPKRDRPGSADRAR
jgi:hypothetical protein